MIDQLHKQFVERGWTWKINGQDVVPTKQDLKDFFEEVNNRVPDGSQMQAGRMIVQVIAGKTDVYLYQGVYGENEEDS